MPVTRDIPLSQIVPPPAPIRATMDDDKLEELARSIAVEGLINALTVEPIEAEESAASPEEFSAWLDGYVARGRKFEVIAGHRRLLACRMNDAVTVRCEIYPAGQLNKFARMLHENAYREDMSPSEEGWAYLEMAEKQGLSLDEICGIARQKPSYVNSRVELVRGDEQIALAVHRGEIKLTVARELNRCSDESYRRYLLGRAIVEGASGLQAKTWVINWKIQEGITPPQPQSVTSTAPPPPVTFEPPACFLCGQSHAPYNLESVYICRYERQKIRDIVAAQLPETADAATAADVAGAPTET